MNLMYNDGDGGFHNFEEEELGEARKNGWVDGEPVRQRILAMKRAAIQPVAPVAKPAESDTLSELVESKRSPGRPRKEVPSVLNDGEV